MIKHLSQKKKIILLISSIVLILAIATAVITPILLNRNKDIGYSYDDEHKPIIYDGVSRLVLYEKIAKVLRLTFIITDKDNVIANVYLNAMSRARIPTEKMLAFADYITGFSGMFLPSLSSPETGEFVPSQENNDFSYYYLQFFEKTAFTEQELGRFLYEIIIDIASEGEYKDIILKLGREDFVSIVGNTAYLFKLILTANSMEKMTASEARVLQAFTYSLGSTYLKTINKIGFDGVEKLFGITANKDKNYKYLTAEEKDAFLALGDKAKGKVTTLLYIIGITLVNVQATTFEQLFAYTVSTNKQELQTKKNLIASYINISQAIKMGIENSFNFDNYSSISDYQSFSNEYADLFSHHIELLDIVSQEEQDVEYEQIRTKAKEDIDYFLESLDILSNIENINSLDQEQIEECFDRAINLWALFDGIDGLINNTFSMLIFNLAIRLIDFDKILDDNRNIIEDMFQSILGG